MLGFAHALGFGLVTSAIVGLSAVALSLQFSVVPIPNFTHGEFLTIGAYAAFAFQTVTNNLILDALAGVAAGTLLALCLNWSLIRPFSRIAKNVVVLVVVTAAGSQIIESLIAMVFGANDVNVQVPPNVQIAHSWGPFLWTNLDVVIMIAAVLAMAILHYLLHYTTFGRCQRAVADDQSLALAAGINVDRVIVLTWGITGALAGLAGVALASTVGSFNNLLGFNFLLLTFAAAIIGGIGRVYAAIAGALIIGCATEIFGYYGNSSYKIEFALVLLLLALLLRPRGLFGPQRVAV
ncbi:MAG: branched-chain amino acid ABC transporter permease [Candidatus Dormibacteria bacterium]